MKILVVDDEPFILEGIYTLLMAEEKWEVFKAPSGREALEILSRYRMDIVLTDIRMRGMDGLFLLQEIKKLWSYCKVIMLTAYDDFDYARVALKGGAFGYLLKTDGDAVILQEIERCNQAIVEEMTFIDHFEYYQQQARAAFPLRQNAALLNVAEWMNYKRSKQELIDNNIDLDLDKPMLLIAAGADSFPDGSNSQVRFEILLQLVDIFRKYLIPRFSCWHITKEDKSMFWILQSDDTTEKSLIYCRQILELVQEHAYQALHISLSIVYDEFIKFDELHIRYQMLQSVLTQIFIRAEERVLADFRFYRNRKERRNEKVGERNTILPLEEMRNALLNSDLKGFEEALDLMLYEEEIESAIGKLNIYHQICASILSYVEIQGLNEEFLSEPEYFEAFCSYSGRRIFRKKLVNLASRLISCVQELNVGDGDNLIQSVHQYIKINLSGDLSLQNIADHMYMNPSYLSRVYKSMTGITLSEKITGDRLLLAKKMLGRREIKISQIARDTGYESAAYFARVFRKHEKLSPQEWRERNI